jgi:hypothetical protein
MDRHYYADHALTLARHPSETDERMMARLLAFALYADNALVFGNELTFDVSRERDGNKYKLHYQGKVTGETLKGSVRYDFDGITGSVDFDGRRLGGSSVQK